MSKIALKKELMGLSREQIIDVVLTAYSSNKTIKEYFDFFTVPDVEKLYERFTRELTKEIIRGKYHQSTARISRIRKSIKNFESFNPGAERVRDLYLFTVNMLVEQKKIKNFSDTLINGTLKLLNEAIAYADKNLIFDSTMQQVDRIIAETSDRSRYFRAFLKRNIELPH
ncbi:MAG: hypothetical protein K2J10_10560 [Muribaculaceae bacterium]|nr:hypothetical protein [Muribaculaceae bacterium]